MELQYIHQLIPYNKKKKPKTLKIVKSPHPPIVYKEHTYLHMLTAMQI